MSFFSSLFGGLEYDLEGLEKETSEYPSSEEENGNGKNDSGCIGIPPDPDFENELNSDRRRRRQGYIESGIVVDLDKSLILPDSEFTRRFKKGKNVDERYGR